MREKVSVVRLRKFMQSIGRAGKKGARIYFVGGANPAIDANTFKTALEDFLKKSS